MQGEIYTSDELEAIMEEKYQTYICDNEELIQKQREKFDQSDIGNKRSFGAYRSANQNHEDPEESKEQIVTKKLGVYQNVYGMGGTYFTMNSPDKVENLLQHIVEEQH